MSFKVGDKVMCITNGTWASPMGTEVKGPTKPEILEIADMYDRHGVLYLCFYEYPAMLKGIVISILGLSGWDSKYFRKLTDDEIQQESLVEEAREIVKERELVAV